jgi:hypothetical protein
MENQSLREKLRYSYLFKKAITLVLDDGRIAVGKVIRYDNDTVDISDPLTGGCTFYSVSSIQSVTQPYF